MGHMSQQTARRPDASMSLLTNLLTNPVEPGYAEAQARQAQQPGRRHRGGVVLAVGLVGLGALLAAAAVQTHNRLPANERSRAALVQQVQDRSEQVDSLQQRLASLRAQIAKAQGQQLALTSTGRELAQELGRLELASASVPVVGPGIKVTVDDAPAASTGANGDPRATDAQSEGTVRDRDLQQVVNGLWAAGAEAVSLNGHRLTSLSAIRAAGEAILVDYRPLVPPYVISAVGDPGRLETGFAADAGGAYLKTIASSFGIQYGIERSDKLHLPGASAFRLDHARPVEEGS
jgi:uncharacterized protein YlxW (UPF0749 family)